MFSLNIVNKTKKNSNFVYEPLNLEPVFFSLLLFFSFSFSTKRKMYIAGPAGPLNTGCRPCMPQGTANQQLVQYGYQIPREAKVTPVAAPSQTTPKGALSHGRRG